jgi:hypothetical protein
MSLKDDIKEWAADVVRAANRSDYSGINPVEKILRDPGFATGGSKHCILWWPRNRRVARMYRAMHRIDTFSQICLIVESEQMVTEDGQIYDKKMFTKDQSISLRRFNEINRNSKSKLRCILST